jgi:Putative Actinobacterial Holin-X, holin superfamily III
MRDVRPLLDVLSDIFANLEDIVRSELRLARAEVAAEVRGLKSYLLGVGVVIVTGTLAAQFLLLSGMYALRSVLTPWGAALAVGGASALVSLTALLVTARRRPEQNTAAPKSTTNLEEESEWAQASIK